ALLAAGANVDATTEWGDNILFTCSDSNIKCDQATEAARTNGILTDDLEDIFNAIALQKQMEALRNPTTSTAVMLAAQYNHPETVKALLFAGATIPKDIR